jgi:hypothetical protein
MMSSASSHPTESLTGPSVIPAARRSGRGIAAWVMLAGCWINESTPASETGQLALKRVGACLEPLLLAPGGAGEHFSPRPAWHARGPVHLAPAVHTALRDQGEQPSQHHNLENAW